MKLDFNIILKIIPFIILIIIYFMPVDKLDNHIKNTCIGSCITLCIFILLYICIILKFNKNISILIISFLFILSILYRDRIL